MRRQAGSASVSQCLPRECSPPSQSAYQRARRKLENAQVPNTAAVCLEGRFLNSDSLVYRCPTAHFYEMNRPADFEEWSNSRGCFCSLASCRAFAGVVLRVPGWVTHSNLSGISATRPRLWASLSKMTLRWTDIGSFKT